MQLAPALADEERLFAEAVARHEEVLAARVPDRKREHPAQALDAALAPMLVRAQQHLGVGIEREAAAERLELASQLAKVVDLAVERQDQAGVVGAHRLARALGIDDGETPVAEDHALAGTRRPFPEPVAVGAAVGEALEHPLDRRARSRALGGGDGPGDAAHAQPFLPANRAVVRGARTTGSRAA